ncbi:radial spoke head protein 9 homolog [Amia ocellicauda]|uniref:radial spoke head protein 9 homolog n=1 Tax=Amia ocellicauda TaxID=2972642 RepID=UPI003464376E|nr:RSPH9 protein [Amia calva]
MDSQTLHYALDLVSGSGLTLSPEQRAALQSSLVIMRANYRFHRVLFWGKILCTKQDYFIAQGLTEDELGEKKTLYSLNCIDWYLLPPATDTLVAETSAVKGRFVGDPSHEYELVEMKRQGEGEEAMEEDITLKIKEENRLAATIFVLDKEVSVVPRGAFIKTPLGHVQRNRSFEGLSVTEAGKLSSYFHFSEPVRLKKKSLLEKADLDPSIDFLDSIEEDIPKGSWSLQWERGNSVLVLRSLLWLGLTFYHVPMTPQHGFLYMGTGLKNLDLPFML